MLEPKFFIDCTAKDLESLDQMIARVEAWPEATHGDRMHKTGALFGLRYARGRVACTRDFLTTEVAREAACDAAVADALASLSAA